MTFTFRLFRRRGRRPPPSPSPGASRSGFTLLELLTAVMVMGTLGRIAVPNVHELVLQARAQEIAANLAVLHMAAVDYQRDRGTWPHDAWVGQVPEGLEPYLPEGFDLQGEGYRLDWERWRVPDGLPDDPRPGELLAVSVVTSERGLGQAVTDLLGGTLPHYALDDRYTFVVAPR